MKPNNDLDHILDEALSEYHDAEPLSGMEDRILRRCAVQSQPSSRRWMWVLATAAAATAMVVAVWLGLRERPHQQKVAARVAQPAQQAPGSTAQIETPALRLPHHTGRESASGRSRVQSQSLRHTMHAITSVPNESAQSQFPVPAPMTTEEHALVILARTHPDALLIQLNNVDRLSITPIEIKPLASEAGASQGEQ